MDNLQRSAIHRELDSLFLPTLLNKDIRKPRLMILFSGAPGIGKSHVAKEIEKELNGLRLENDIIRELIIKKYPNLSFDERAHLTYDYSIYVWDKLISEVKNGLWIIDSSIDRRYDTIYQFANKNNFAIFLIAIRVPEDVLKARIKSRGNLSFTSTERYLVNMEARLKEQDEFLSKYKPDVQLGKHDNIKEVISLISDKLKKID